MQPSNLGTSVRARAIGAAQPKVRLRGKPLTGVPGTSEADKEGADEGVGEGADEGGRTGSSAGGGGSGSPGSRDEAVTLHRWHIHSPDGSSSSSKGGSLRRENSHL